MTSEGRSALRAVDQHFSEVADSWIDRYATRPSFQARYLAVGAAIRQHLPPGGTVLDFGAGPGVFSVLASARANMVLSVDASLPMLRAGGNQSEALVGLASAAGMTARPERVHRVAGDISVLDQAGVRGRFDLVLAIAVLEYLADVPRHLEVLLASLRPGGLLVFTVPNPRSLVRRVERPVDRAATALGRLNGSRRLADRAYGAARPAGSRVNWQSILKHRQIQFRQTALPLGPIGWRRVLRPSVLVLAGPLPSS